MIKAKNTFMKERIWFNCVTSEVVFQPLHPDTGVLLHDGRVIASNSTSDTLLMKHGHPGNFLFSWSERKLLSIRSILHVCVEEEEWEVVSRGAIDGKESETERVIILRGHPWSSRCATGMCEADSDCTHGSLNQRRQS